MEAPKSKQRFSVYLDADLVERLNAIVAAMANGISSPSRNEIAAHVIATGLPIVEQQTGVAADVQQ